MTQIRPIRTEADHAAALARAEELWGAPDGSAEADELDVWVTLIDAGETANEPIPPPDPVEVIRFRVEHLGLTRKDLEPVLGSRSRVSEVLPGKRGLSLATIRRLRDELELSADVLVG